MEQLTLEFAQSDNIVELYTVALNLTKNWQILINCSDSCMMQTINPDKQEALNHLGVSECIYIWKCLVTNYTYKLVTPFQVYCSKYFN